MIAVGLPMAIAIAVSPFAIVPAMWLLSTPRPRATAGSFLLGWLLGVAAVTAVGVALADAVDLMDDSPTWVSWVRIVGGVLLLGYGLWLWLTRHRTRDLPAWMRALSEATPGSALRLGLLLSAANPKVLVLALAGGLAMGGEDGTLGAQAVAVLGFAAVAAVVVAVPLVVYLLVGRRAVTALDPARSWIERNNGTVMAVLVLVIGVFLLVKGLQGR